MRTSKLFAPDEIDANLDITSQVDGIATIRALELLSRVFAENAIPVNEWENRDPSYRKITQSSLECGLKAARKLL